MQALKIYRRIVLATIVLGTLPVLPAVAQLEAMSGQSASHSTAMENGDPAQTESEGVETVVIKGETLQSALGREVRTKDEEDMGRIVDLLCDRKGEVKAAVIEFGGFLGIGTRKIAVEWSALRFDANSKPPVAILDMAREQLQRVPEYKPRTPAVTRKTVN